jgi:GMP reductase
MLIDSEPKLNFSDVMIRPKRTTLESRSDVTLSRIFNPKYGTPFEGIPVMASNMATGTFKMLDVFSKYGMFVSIAKFVSSGWINNSLTATELSNRLAYGFYTIGMSDVELEAFDKYYKFINECRYSGITSNKIKLCVDIANGYSQKFAGFISKIRDRYPDIVIVAGNVVTPDMTMELILGGADYVKCGIGPGSKCSTRLKTGVGYPQLSAIIECADAAHGLSAGIIADGGIRSPGDVAKAFCANADIVMIGGMFSGTDECEGEIITRYFKTGELTLKYEDADGTKKFEEVIEEKKFKLFYGMSSEYAQKTHMGEMKEYRTSEGLVEEVPYIGSVETVVKDILGGLRSTGTYIGADEVKNFGKCATFIKTNKIHDKF